MQPDKKSPAFLFYPNDWQNDLRLRMCSLAAQGLWMGMMCWMHQGEPYGHLRVKGEVIQPDKLSELIGKPVDVITPLLSELEQREVFSRDESGCIYSRRMVKDDEKRRKAAANGSKGGNPRLKETPEQTGGEPTG